MCDKKNSVLFNDIECIVLSPNFKLTDESHVLLKVLRKNNMYSVDLKNIVPKGGLTCLFAKATSDEFKLWHKRLGHINFKTMNKLVKGNLVRGLPSKLFENDQTCVACQKGKKHRASCKSKTVSSISQPLHMLHMDLFGPTFLKSLRKKMYCLVVTDDYSRFSWVFFLATKDETSGILKSFITRVENLIDQKVKVIRCDNETEFKNKEMNQFCERKGIKIEFSVARTPQQNGVAKRKNRTLIKADRTMLADSKLPTTFWAEAVNTACYVQNRILVTKPYNKNLYELFLGRKPALGFMRPFRCPIIIHNTINHLGKFDGKVDEGFFIGYSINSKEFRVFNSKTRIVEENLHVQYSENIPNIAGSRPNWLFDIDALTKSMNYKPVVVGNQSNSNVGTKACDDACKARMESVPGNDYIILPLWTADPPFSQISKSSPNAGFKPSSDDGKKVDEDSRNSKVNAVCGKTSIQLPDDPNMPHLEDIVYSDDDEDVGVEADMTIWIHLCLSVLTTRRLEFSTSNKKNNKEFGRTWDKGDILLVQMYVDDIIFGFTKKSLCIEFNKMMHKKFQMSFMGELTFFLGLQVKQKEDGIFISNDKSMIGLLMYLTSSRPDIMFVVCACARYQVNLKVSHLHAVKRIGSLVVANSTTEAEYVAASSCCGQVLWIQNQLLDYGYNFLHTKIFIDNKIILNTAGIINIVKMLAILINRECLKARQQRKSESDSYYLSD
ncbi:putative ribonuclease H-like domain-containing protein [Tanacetum coccineum]